MPKRELEEWSYDYKRLKVLYPLAEKFYAWYYDGDYYNKAHTTYYDQDGKELETEMHSYYG